MNTKSNNSKKNIASTKKKRAISSGIINVFATFNNTIVNICDLQGNVLCWSSTGKHGFKGSKKATPYAAQVTTQQALDVAKTFGLQNAVVKIIGPGVGREAALRAVHASGILVSTIEDNTYLPHNGCRPPKRRRI